MVKSRRVRTWKSMIERDEGKKNRNNTLPFEVLRVHERS